MESIIELKKVNYWYDHGKANEMQALKDISLEIKRGDYVAFFGPSGSGKTTLLYLLSGTELSQNGEIIINGRDIGKLSHRELALYRQMGVGMVFQQFNLIPNLSILDNVALPMTFLGISEIQRVAESKKLLDRLGILDLAKRFPYELSGGQQQRVGIARALANNAPIIVADEPIGNLDSISANKVLDFLKELHEKDGKTIIMVTHEAWSLRDANHIFYMKDGLLEKTGQNDSATSASDAIQHVYKQLVPNEPKEKAIAFVITNLLLRGFSADETERFENFFYRRLTGKIDRQELLRLLNSPYREGGGGLWRQRALKVSHYLEEVAQEHLTLETMRAELAGNMLAPLSHEVEQISVWLLQDYKGHPDELQKIRFQEVVEEVLRSIISPEAFKQVLYLPKSRLGVGFSHRSTEEIYEKFKTILGDFNLNQLSNHIGQEAK